MFLLKIRQKHLPHVLHETLADRPKSQGEANGISGVATTADAFFTSGRTREMFHMYVIGIKDLSRKIYFKIK